MEWSKEVPVKEGNARHPIDVKCPYMEYHKEGETESILEKKCLRHDFVLWHEAGSEYSLKPEVSV